VAPELLPENQFQKAGAIKAAFFLIGGLLGYVVLLFTTHIHYTWVYYSYLAIKIPTAMPTFWLLDNDLPGAIQQKSGGESGSLLADIKQAYTIPTKFVGGFPRLALGSFLFMAGTAPIFFLFLIIRDLVGITDSVELQSVLAESSQWR